jgi:hypothetical protein
MAMGSGIKKNFVRAKGGGNICKTELVVRMLARCQRVGELIFVKINQSRGTNPF